MKKITLLLLLLCFSLGLSAQVLNQPAAWPNTNWTVTGTFNTDPDAFEADPTLTSNFAFDDDDAGGGSDDDIAAESPVIDLSAAFTAGETWLFLDVDYTYNDLGDVLNLEYWDADTSTWEVWQQFNATAVQPTNNFCAGARDSFTSNQLNIAGFTTTQLSGFQYRVAFYDDGPGGGAGFEWGFCFDAPTITSQTPPTCPDPDTLSVSNVLETSVDLEWNETGSATVWNIEWGPAGFTPGSGTTETGLTATIFTLTGLTSGTSYDFYVQSDCGGDGTSNFIGPFNFATAVAGATCAAAFPMTVEADCATATPTTFDFSLGEDIDANDENPSCDGFGNFGYWVSFTAPAVGSVVFNFSGGADNIGLEVLDSCGGTAVSACSNNIFDDGDSSDIIGGLTPGDTYVAVIWRDTQSGTADVCLQPGPSCTFPVNLDATNITLDGADLSWTENGTATIWNVEVVLSGDAPTGTPTATGVSNPYTVTGLSANTEYDFYVQADCGGGDISDFAGPFSFTTLCDVFVPDYIEQFDTIIPQCWDEADSGDATTGPGDLGAGSWIADEFINLGTNDGAYKINLFTNTKSDWILSPQFDLTGGPFQVEFDFAITNWNSSTVAGTLGSDDLVQLLISNDNGVTWTPLITYDSTSTVPLPGITPVVTLEAYAGQTVQFGILGSEGTVDDAQDIDVFVDNFRVRGIPTCAEPTDLTSTNLSLTSTEVAWTESGTSTVWNIEYGEAGFALGTGTVETGVTTNPFVLTGLMPDTEYEFYVQAVCDPTNISSFAGPGSFFTGYCASEPTSNDGEGVTNVTIGVTDFPSFGDVTYENQTSPVVNVFQGIDTNVAVTFATGFTYGTNIWIDFNDDLVFDATELVFSGVSTNANPTTLDASFTMPITAPLGEHRMRIGTADTGQATPNPCYSGTWGVTLDFTVNIQQLTCTLPEADFTVNTDCDNDQFFIDVDVTSLGDATSLEISNDFDATTVQTTATGVVQAGPFPFGNTVKIFVTNEQDNNCVISSPFFEVLACPPLNDECNAATVALVNADESCGEINPGTILAATPSGVPDGSCAGSPDDDVWFQFTALGDQQIIDIQNITGGTTNIDHAVYEGACDSLTELYCSDDTFSLTPSLIIGNTYYIRIFSAGENSETSTFDLCISTLGIPAYCLDALPICADPSIQYESVVGDQTAPPYLDYDCLGSQPDPQWNTILFDEAGDYVFSLDQTNAGGTPLDIDFLVWGPFVDQQGGCVELLPDTIADCSFSATASETITLTNVPANSTYVILITNFSQQAGFYTFTQDSGPVDGTNCNVVCDVSLELDGAPVEDDIEDPAATDEIFDYCGFDSVNLEATTFYSVDEYVWFKDGFAIEDFNESTLTATESGTYQVQVLGGICDQSETYFSALIEINFYDEASPLDPQNLTVCDGPSSDGSEEFDLDALTTSLGYGADFIVSYYTNTSDANQAINPVTSPYSSSGELLIIRIEDANASADGFLGCRQLSEVELVVNTRPDATQPADFIVCDDVDGTVDGITQFDLTSIDAEISTNPDVTITYHASQDDADTNTGALVSPYSSSGEIIYIRVEDNNTGCFETTTFNLVVNIVPLASFDDQFEYEVCPNATVPITIGIVPDNFTEADVTVTWLLDGAVIAGANGLTIDTVLEQGDYSAEIMFNTTGCTNTITVEVEELESCIFPQGISPGEMDGLNDRFDLSSFNVTKLQIFNRNGTLVYSKTDYTDEWIGQTNDGEELPVGTYFYTVEYEGGAKRKSAWVYISR